MRLFLTAIWDFIHICICNYRHLCMQCLVVGFFGASVCMFHFVRYVCYDMRFFFLYFVNVDICVSSIIVMYPVCDV